jgi:hypothetical protein
VISATQAAEQQGWGERIMSSMRALYSSVLSTITGRGGDEPQPEARQLVSEPQPLTAYEPPHEEPEVNVAKISAFAIKPRIKLY